MKAYKWESPGDWLHDKINTWSEAEVRDAFRSAIANMDSDTIQDIFQSDMDADGYFQEED